MKSVKKPTILILAVLAIAGVLAGTAASQAVFAPAKVAFVDVGRVFKEYKKAAEIQQKIREDLRKIDAPLLERFNDIKKREGELELLLEGTPEFRAKKREIDRDKFLLEWDERDQKEAVRLGLVDQMTQVYTQIRNEAENFARRNGLSGVFMVNTHELKARSQEELQVLIASRPVLYWDKALDITDEILEVMNGGAGGGTEEEK